MPNAYVLRVLRSVAGMNPDFVDVENKVTKTK